MPLKRKKRGPKPKVKPVVRTLRFFYENDRGLYRWWRNDMPGDVFDIITKEELDQRIKGAEFIGVMVIDHLPGFCSEGDNCPDHKGYH